jgi:hypothetical protein
MVPGLLKPPRQIHHERLCPPNWRFLV